MCFHHNISEIMMNSLCISAEDEPQKDPLLQLVSLQKARGMLGDQRLIGCCVWEDGGRGDQSEVSTGGTYDVHILDRLMIG